MRNRSGIYAIRNKANGKCYVGSAVNLKARWSQHKHKLESGTHHSKHLQSSWNKNGCDAFEFVVLEYVDQNKDLVESEQCWIDKLSAWRVSYYAEKRLFDPKSLKQSREHVEKRESARLATLRAKKAAGTQNELIAVLQ